MIFYFWYLCFPKGCPCSKCGRPLEPNEYGLILDDGNVADMIVDVSCKDFQLKNQLVMDSNYWTNKEHPHVILIILWQNILFRQFKVEKIVGSFGETKPWYCRENFCLRKPLLSIFINLNVPRIFKYLHFLKTIYLHLTVLLCSALNTFFTCLWC